MALGTFRFALDIDLVAGPETLVREAPLLIRSMGMRNALICTDRGIIRAGILDRLEAALRESEGHYEVFDGVVANPRIETVEAGLGVYRDAGCDGIVAIGGGSPIDTAKTIGILATNAGSVPDFEGFNRVAKPLPPLLAVPTTYGTGSEMTSAAIITDEHRQRKMLLADGKLVPAKVILDPSLVLSLPRMVAASTGMDALTHAIESYVSSRSIPPTDALNLTAIRLIANNLLMASDNTTDIEPSAMMLYASAIAGAAFSRTGLGITHALAHALGGLMDLPHGIANAILLPHVMQFNLPVCPSRFVDIAQAMGRDVVNLPQEEAAAEAAKAVRRLALDLGLPQSLKQVGVRLDQADNVAGKALKDPTRLTNPRPADKAELVQVVRNAM